MARHAHREISDPHGLQRVEEFVQFGSLAPVDPWRRRLADGGRRGGTVLVGCAGDVRSAWHRSLRASWGAPPEAGGAVKN